MKPPVPLPKGAKVTVEAVTEVRRREAVLRTGVLQNAILHRANSSSGAADEKGVIPIFHVGAERMVGYSQRPFVQAQLATA